MRLKGSSTGTQAKPRTARSIEFKIRVVQLKRNEGKSTKDALATACTEFSLPPTDSMTNHPASIFSSYEKEIATKLENKDANVEALVAAAGLDEDDDSQTAAVSDSDIEASDSESETSDD